MLPVNHQEAIQVLQYEPTEQYRAHYDYFNVKGDDLLDSPSGNRFVTVLMYLNSVLEGGETCFPLGTYADGLGSSAHEKPAGEWSECARNVKGPCVKPKKGSAIMFFGKDPYR